LIDTHAHIYLKDFNQDLDEVLAQSKVLGVEAIYMPNIDHTTIEDMMEVERRQNDYCHAMIGLHPCSVNKDFERELYIVEDWLSKRDFLAVGEIGTDLYWDNTFFTYQQEAFVQQVIWAQKYHLPVVIHCRNSIEETVELLENRIERKISGVFHCFTGDLKQAQKVIRLGCKLGIGGVATFKEALFCGRCVVIAIS